MTFFPTDSSRPGQGQKCSRRVATPEIGALFNRRYATKPGNHLSPALKRRAQLIPTLRVEDLIRASSSLTTSMKRCVLTLPGEYLSFQIRPSSRVDGQVR